MEILSISLFIIGGLFMKTFKMNSNKKLVSDLKELWRIETKMLKTNNSLTAEEVKFLKTKAEDGVPLGEFDYGLYYLLIKNDEKTAEEWWNKFFYHCNGFGLWMASGIFSCLGDLYYDWSIKCLQRSARLQFELSKMMLEEMKKNPYKFPEA